MSLDARHFDWDATFEFANKLPQAFDDLRADVALG